MKLNITYDEILKLDTLNKFEPAQVVGILGHIFETSRESGNITDLKKGLYFSGKENPDRFKGREKMLFYYKVANGWSYLQRLTQKLNSPKYWEFEAKELEMQIINYRLA